MWDLDLMEKDKQNINAIVYKLGPALIRITNHRLKNRRKEKQKKEIIVEKRKVKALAAKYCWARRKISLSSAKKRNYKSDTKDNTDPD